MNAFLNAKLTEEDEIYVVTPLGYYQSGVVLRLKRPLHGLRRSPILWQHLFKASLRHLGFHEISEEPCLYSNHRLLLFYYVDDIVLLARSEDLEEMDLCTQRLCKMYQMRDLGEISVFLGIHIIRDRKQRSLLLNQISYIDKLAQRFDRGKQHHIRTPFSGGIDLSQIHDGPPDSTKRAKFQTLIGSLLYIAVTTRPDVSFVVGLLSRHSANPSSSHVRAAERVIDYLITSKDLSLQYCSDTQAFDASMSTIDVSSDAAYADDSSNRKSTEGFY